MTTLLDDFLSGDTQRVLHATWTTIRSRDRDVVDPLIPHLERIRRATAKLELGGILRPNSANVAHALTTLENRRRGLCWCEDYRGHDQYDPRREERDGHVRVDATSEPGWSMTFVCACTVCGQVFDVEQGEYHVMWWRWVPRGETRSSRR